MRSAPARRPDDAAPPRAAIAAGGRRWLPAAVGAGATLAAGLALFGVLGFTGVWYRFFDASDLPVYHAYAGALDRGLRAFVDFQAEYPPLALRLFAFPGHPGAAAPYALSFAALMLAALAGAGSLVSVAAERLWPGRRIALAVAATFGGSVLALGAIVANRYDATVALSLAAFLWGVAARRWTVAGLALGLGVALKLTPAVLVPALVLLPTSRRERARGALAFAIAAVTPFAAEGAAAWRGVAAVVRFHGARPLQIESVLATPLLLAHVLAATPAAIGNGFGSQVVVAPGAPALALLSGPLAALALAVVHAVAWRQRSWLRGDPRALALLVVAVLLALLVPAKVLSPQYLVWLLPATALLAPTAPGLAALLGAALLLTQVEFPSLYWRLVALEPMPIGVVALRNLALLVGLGWSVALLWRGPVRAGPGDGSLSAARAVARP